MCQHACVHACMSVYVCASMRHGCGRACVRVSVSPSLHPPSSRSLSPTSSSTRSAHVVVHSQRRGMTIVKTGQLLLQLGLYMTPLDTPHIQECRTFDPVQGRAGCMDHARVCVWVSGGGWVGGWGCVRVRACVRPGGRARAGGRACVHACVRLRIMLESGTWAGSRVRFENICMTGVAPGR